MHVTMQWISPCEYLQEMQGSFHPFTSLHLVPPQKLASVVAFDLSARCKMLAL